MRTALMCMTLILLMLSSSSDARPGESCIGRYVGTNDPCNSTNCDDACRIENKEEPLCQGRCSQVAKCYPIACMCKFCRFP
ncbi:hypothetical protein ZWY2020_038515 [Hordeum vulgare]|nr:hypothetical protein ZWY2020_038514 [Hordeum vulgare]KAI4990152.1 hypothetical protein ZWY2020_038515 [Hordeum vulgare]